MASGDFIVRVLGPVQLVMSKGEVVDLPSASQRRLLAALALHAPRPVRTEWLCDVLAVTPGALRTSVARLRKALGEGVVHTSVVGYRLAVPVDATVACEELELAAGDPEAIRRALAWWVAPVLQEFADEPWAVADAVRLDERRESAVEDLADALIAHHRADEAVAALEPHVIVHPYRDRPRGLLIRALASAGRQTEALRVFQTYRAFLADSVGNEPSAELRRIEQRVAAGWNGVDVVGHPDRPTPEGPPISPPARAVPEVLVTATSLVGRHAELAVLVDAARQGVRGRPRAVLLSGEAGIGKTTLIAEFVREHCAPSGWSVLYGRCDEFAMEPFQPFRGLLGSLVDDLPDEVLSAHTATCGGDLLWLVPQLRARVPSSARSVVGDEITARHLLFEAVVDIVRRAAGIRPLVLVVDDLHWAEPTGLHLLRHLARNLGGSPVLIVASFRDTGDGADEELRAAAADLARVDTVRVELKGLAESELRELVVSRVPAAAGHDVAAVAELLRTETAGNPLYAEHLLQHWAGSGLFAVTDGTVTVRTQALRDVPTTLRDLVWHRVNVLGHDAKPVLTAAAVLGVQFEERVLAAMTGIERHELGDLLDRAVAAGVLADDGSQSGTARFAHALVARSMDAELGSRARTRLHAQAFEAVRSASPTPPAQRLARHAEQAGLLAEAQHWATEAGDRALANLAPDEAVEWFTTALGHATALARPDDERADLLVRIGESAYRAGHPGALDFLYDGAVLAERCGADATLRRAALATDPGSIQYGAFAPKQLAISEAALARLADADHDKRVRITARFAQSLAHTDRTAVRRAAAFEALELARTSEDCTLIARVAPDLLYALWGPGLGAVRAEVAEAAIAIVETTSDPHLAFGVYHAAHMAAVCAGDAERAQVCLDGMRAVTRDVQDPRMRWTTGVVDAFDATMRARLAEAEQLIGATFELGTQIAEPFAIPSFTAQAFVVGIFAGRHEEMFPILQRPMDTQESLEEAFRIAHAIVCAELGRHEVPRALLREAMHRGIGAIPDDILRSTTLLGYAILAIETGDVEAAAWVYPEIVPMAGEVAFNGVTSQGPVSAYVGRLASMLGLHDDAEPYLRDALATAEAFGWEYNRATSLIALARNQLWGTGNLDARGEQWLTTAEHLCAKYGFASWVKRTEAVRAQAYGVPG
ncbi:MAG: ATP-binding protein [Ilumatobacteraceae bacterium]